MCFYTYIFTLTIHNAKVKSFTSNGSENWLFQHEEQFEWICFLVLLWDLEKGEILISYIVQVQHCLSGTTHLSPHINSPLNLKIMKSLFLPHRLWAGPAVKGTSTLHVVHPLVLRGRNLLTHDFEVKKWTEQQILGVPANHCFWMNFHYSTSDKGVRGL